jgi:hypothetical protein
MKRGFLGLMLVVGVLSCASGGGGRYYDADHGDYHTFSDGSPDVAIYAQWETSTNRPHEDFSKRSASDQKEYFNYAHTKPSQKPN